MEDLISIDTRHGTIRGKLRKQGKESFLTLLVHGFASYHDWKLFRDLSSKLNCSSFRFDMPGVNLSEGVYTVGLNQNIEVCEDIMTYFHNKGYNIYSGLGHSKGASVLLGAVSRMSTKVLDIKKLVLLSPTFTYRPMLPGDYTEEEMRSLREEGHFEFSPRGVPGKPITVTKAGLDERKKYDNGKVCDLVKEKDVDILIVRGSKDDVSTLESICQFKTKLSSSVSRASYIEIPGANHGFSGYYDQIVSLAEGFLSPQ